MKKLPIQPNIPTKWQHYKPEQIYTQLNSFPMEVQEFLSTVLPSPDSSWLSSALMSLSEDKPHMYADFIKEIAGLYEEDGITVIESHIDKKFTNWGETIVSVPAVTFVPQSIAGIQNIVNWVKNRNKNNNNANSNGNNANNESQLPATSTSSTSSTLLPVGRRKPTRIRCSGYRHTWNTQYADDNDVLISLLPLQIAEHIPALEPAMDPRHFQFATFVDQRRGLVRFGAATTMEHIRVWSTDMAPGGGQRQWSLPFNVVMVEITIVGAVTAMCHGAGSRHKTLADLVVELEHVDHRGVLCRETDPNRLRAAAGSFGLVGVITSVVLQLVPMEIAILRPEKMPHRRAIPRPHDLMIRTDDKKEEGKQQQQQQDLTAATAAQREFVRHCEQDWYYELFWFPGDSENAWINSFSCVSSEDNEKKNRNDTHTNNAKKQKSETITIIIPKDHDSKRLVVPEPYPSEWTALNQWLQMWVAQEIMDSWLVDSNLLVSGKNQMKMLGQVAMHMLPVTESPPRRVFLSDALHFRKGIQNMRVRNFEVELPLYPVEPGGTQVDWSLCNRAWWDAVDIVNEMDEETPLRMTLEMRVMGGSDMLLAAQHGNQWGTCSIEVISTLTVPQKTWAAFKQRLIDKWFSYRNPHTGGLLKARPHWNKEWIEDNLHVTSSSSSESMLQYMKRIYAEQFIKFKKVLWPNRSHDGTDDDDDDDVLLFSNRSWDAFLK